MKQQLEYSCDFPFSCEGILKAIWNNADKIKIGLTICPSTDRYCLYLQDGVKLCASPWRRGEYYFTVGA